MLKHLSSALCALTIFSVPLSASADAGGELTLSFGVADRSTTSTGSLLGLGYDQSTGPIGTLDARLFIDESSSVTRYFRHGPVLRASYFAGPTLGAEGFAFRDVPIDLGYAGRLELPCLADGDRHFYLQGFLAVTGVHADAGRGDHAVEPNSATELAVIEASRTLDHAGVGGALGVGIDMHVGAFVLGVGVDLRQYFGVDTAVARDLIWSGMLRLGVDVTPASSSGY
jgi:hypothetical protein